MTPSTRHPLLKAGLHPDASDALRRAGVTAARIGQTIGDAPASAGTHAQDGAVDGHPYCAAVDLRCRDLSEQQIRNLLSRLAKQGFAAWYRRPGRDHWPADQAEHIHAVYAGAPMKRALRDQVHSWCAGRNGLRSNVHYAFWQPDEEEEQTVRTLFLAHNRPSG